MSSVTPINVAQGVDRKLSISTGTSRTAKRTKQKRVTWSMFVEDIREPTRTNETYSEYMQLSKAEQDAIKDVGFFVGGRLEGGIRKKDRLTHRDLLTLDIDFAEPDFELDLDLIYGEYAFACYSTHKHNPDSPRLRLIFPLSRQVSPDEYPAIARKVAEWWGMDVFDDTTYQASRVMYWPSCSKDADFYFFESDSADFLDPDRVLAEYDDWADVSTWPVSSRQLEATERMVAKAQDPLEKRGAIGDFCRAYSIPEAIAAFLPDVYEPGYSEDRYTFTGGTTSNGAIVYNDGRFLYSNHGTDPAGGHSVNAWDLVRLHKFGELDKSIADDTSPTKRPSHKAMLDLVNNDPVVADSRIEAMSEDWDDDEVEPETPIRLAPGSRGVPEIDTSAPVYTDEDRDQLRKLDYNEDGTLKNHITNAILLLNHTKALKGSIAWNEFLGDIVQVRDLPGLPVVDKVNGDLWSDAHDSWVVAYIHNKHGIELPGVRMLHTVNNVAAANKFHPVRDFLDSIQWDGKKRVDTLLIDHLKADDSLYARTVTRKTLCAAVARIFSPGIKFDNMLILEGNQGIGKSSFLQSLALGWFTDDVGGLQKDTVENMKGKWIGEIGELTQYRKAEVDHIKAFLSRQVDRMREAYGKRSKDFRRHWIMIGSTNDDAGYLKDEENRRFWPVRCHRTTFIKPLPVEEVVQIWAEALTIWRDGESLDLDNAEVIQAAKKEQAARQSDRDVVEELVAWLDHGESDFDDEPVAREYVSVADIWEGFFNKRGKPDHGERAQIRKLMKLAPGWSAQAEPRTVNGKSTRVYYRM